MGHLPLWPADEQIKEAMRWYGAAAGQGNQWAKKQVARLKREEGQRKWEEERQRQEDEKRRQDALLIDQIRRQDQEMRDQGLW